MNDSFTLIQEVTKFGDTVKAKVKSKKKRSSQNKQAEVQLTPQEQQERQEQLRRVYTFNNVAKRGFLKLLLRLRRVLLKDAAILIDDAKQYNPVLTPASFQHTSVLGVSEGCIEWNGRHQLRSLAKL